ncbi:MAG: PqqD family peptide modification chaperone [Desulfovibrio sp.]|nr:PqqD family peptide modification chaperone [Desulfovibrio sp.]
MICLSFAHLSLPVYLRGCTSLPQEIQNFFAAWPFTTIQPAREYPHGPSLTMGADAKGRALYTVDAPWLPTHFQEDSLACALCNLSIEMIIAVCREHGLLCLHAAALRMGRHMPLLLGSNGAGKSSLAARLMANGHTGYGDDLVGMSGQGTALSFGIAPRLRLPLPPSPTLAAFVHSCQGISDARYCYLDPASVALARHGEEKPVSHCILLQRRQGADARLRPLPPQTALLRLLPRYIMQCGEAAPLLQQAAALAGRLPVLLLRYDSVDAAAACLEQYLELYAPIDHENAPCIALSEVRQAGTGHVPLPTGRGVRRRRPGKAPARQRWQQRSGVRVLRHGRQLFLSAPAGSALHRLNPLGQAVWSLLESPLSMAEAAGLLAEAFPGTGRERIRKDTARLFQDLCLAGLIVAV